MVEEKIPFFVPKRERLPTIFEDCCTSQPSPKRPSYPYFFACTGLLFFLLLIGCRLVIHVHKCIFHKESGQAFHPSLYYTTPNELELVLSTARGSNISWIHDHLSSWPANIYRLDDPHTLAPSVPSTKGGEAMAYLTFIIDRYRTLPDVTVFLRDKRYIWFNDNPLYGKFMSFIFVAEIIMLGDSQMRLDNVISVLDLQTPFVQSAGYVNLRCALKWGCPVQLEPTQLMRENKINSSQPAEMEYPFEFINLFPGIELPEVVGVPTGGQFAVSRDKILERPREDYIRYREWLMKTSLEDEVASKIMEYSWHSKFLPVCLVFFESRNLT